jgi:hypothetical protein
MARNSQQNSAELRKEIARSRIQVERDFRGLRNELDFPKKIRRSVRRQPLPWMVSAAAVVALVVIAATRKKTVRVDGSTAEKPKSKLLQAGFVLGALKIAASLIKPAVLPFLEKKFGELAGRGGAPRRRV